MYEATKQIPKGRVATYAGVASAIGHPRAFRAVGNALHINPYKNVPCHRVVHLDGSVGGFAGGAEAKIRLLGREGVEIKKGRVDLNKYGFRIKRSS